MSRKVTKAVFPVAGMGTRSPMTNWAFSPSVTRSCGLAMDLVSLSLLRKLSTMLGTGPTIQCCTRPGLRAGAT